jgi:hypothetical protein
VSTSTTSSSTRPRALQRTGVSAVVLDGLVPLSVRVDTPAPTPMIGIPSVCKDM